MYRASVSTVLENPGKFKCFVNIDAIPETVLYFQLVKLFAMTSTDSTH